LGPVIDVGVSAEVARRDIEPESLISAAQFVAEFIDEAESAPDLWIEPT
jgi:hypothetical protein